MKFSIRFFVFAALPLLFACQKEFDQRGCTDPIAVNYEPRALHDDGSCAYNQAVQMIWSNGMEGGWNGNLTEGAYRLEVCAGAAEQRVHAPDSLTEYRTLSLTTAGGEDHLSWFTLINERDARDFTEGSLRFDCRITEGGSPQFVNLFISGKVPGEPECTPYRRSTFVEISTHSFNDSVFTPVIIPIRNFGQLMMARTEVVCGFEFSGERNTSVEIDNLRWSANQDPDPEPVEEADPEDEEEVLDEETSESEEDDDPQEDPEDGEG